MEEGCCAGMIGISEAGCVSWNEMKGEKAVLDYVDMTSFVLFKIVASMPCR